MICGRNAMPDVKETIQRVKDKSKRKDDRRALIQWASFFTAVALAATPVVVPNMLLKKKQKNMQEEIKELVDIKAQEKKYKATRFDAQGREATDFLRENGYSLLNDNDSNDTAGIGYTDVVDKNDVSVGLARICYGEGKSVVSELLVVNDSELMTLLQTQQDSGFKYDGDGGKLSALPGGRFVHAMSRAGRIDILKRENHRLEELRTGVRTRYIERD